MDEKIKTWTLRFSAKENPNMEIALTSYCNTIGQSNNAKYRLISRKFSGMITWDQALFSFRFENYIPADKAKRKESPNFSAGC